MSEITQKSTNHHPKTNRNLRLGGRSAGSQDRSIEWSFDSASTDRNSTDGKGQLVCNNQQQLIKQAAASPQASR